jgi:Domain of unknown function (DUF4279)
MNERVLTEIAVREILHPTFELTKQYIKHNGIVRKDGVPCVTDVIIKEKENTAEVWFPVVGEKYYFVIYLDLEPHPSVRWMGMSAGNSVYFLVSSETFTLDELIHLVGIAPTRIWERGTLRCLEICPVAKKSGEVEDKLKALLEVLWPFKQRIRELAEVTDTGIHIVYHGYKEEMCGISLDTETLQRLAELNLGVDIDLFAGGPDLE